MTQSARRTPPKQRPAGPDSACIISKPTKIPSACIALAGTTGTNVSAWMAGATYGLAALALEAALLILVVVLLASLPADRVDRLFRAGRLLLDRPEHPAPARQSDKGRAVNRDEDALRYVEDASCLRPSGTGGRHTDHPVEDPGLTSVGLLAFQRCADGAPATRASGMPQSSSPDPSAVRRS